MRGIGNGMLGCLVLVGCATSEPVDEATDGQPVKSFTIPIGNILLPEVRIVSDLERMHLREGVAITPIADSSLRSAKVGVRMAAAQYPEGFLDRYLDEVWVVGTLHLRDRKIAGLAEVSLRVVMLSQSADTSGRTYRDLEHIFHHEIAHLVFDTENLGDVVQHEFERYNPGGFAYGAETKGGVTAKHPGAFVNAHAESSSAEDFAEITAVLFGGNESLKSFEGQAALLAKARVVESIYRDIDPRFEEGYFHRMWPGIDMESMLEELMPQIEAMSGANAMNIETPRGP